MNTLTNNRVYRIRIFRAQLANYTEKPELFK